MPQSLVHQCQQSPKDAFVDHSNQTGSSSVSKSINNPRSSSQHLSFLWRGQLQTTSLMR